MKKRGRALQQDFFRRPSEEVARDLLGKFIVRQIDGEVKALPITEVEIYDGFKDEASHAFKGRTRRAEIMFNEGGFWYIYLCYGMYWMVNVVTGEKDYPSAILIRGAGELNGPGKLTREMEIDKEFNKEPISQKTGLWIEDRGLEVSSREIEKKPRVGINYAREPWKEKLWRYVWKNPEK
jgi:DNA-3-methyladenine glycosylase